MEFFKTDFRLIFVSSKLVENGYLRGWIWLRRAAGLCSLIAKCSGLPACPLECGHDRSKLQQPTKMGRTGFFRVERPRSVRVDSAVV